MPRTLVFLCCLIAFFSPVKAQQNHFIYLQTENRQPFYVKLDKKLYSSSASGYLLLSKLKDGSYPLTIGFPKSEWPEQNLVCKVDQKDNGYLLKNFGDKGWGLFNLQSLDVVMATTKPIAPGVTKETKTDAFSDMLANVVNDPAIRDADPKEPVKDVAKEPVKPPIEPDVVKPEPVKTDPVATDNTIKPVTEVAKSVVTRLLLNTNSTGTEMLYVDMSNGKKDTIAVFIPADAKESKTDAAPKKIKAIVTEPATEIKETVEANNKSAGTKFLPIEVSNHNTAPQQDKKPEQPAEKTPEQTVTDKKEPVVTETKAPVIEEAVVLENQETAVPEIKEQVLTEKKAAIATAPDKPVEIPVVTAAPVSPMVNSDCKGFATEEDFLKLRKKMAASENDDAMMSAAKKLLKSKCFTTEQVKNLSVLFLTDAGKYAFFDMTYPFVSDSHFFSSLSSQLTDPYYIDRFKVMIRK